MTGLNFEIKKPIVVLRPPAIHVSTSHPRSVTSTGAAGHGNEPLSMVRLVCMAAFHMMTV